MVKFIHCADIHLGKNQNNLDQRFEDFGNAFRYVVEEALQREVDFFLIAGDLFDKRNINARTLKQAVEILEPLRRAEIPVIAVEGNHDKAFLRDKESWISYLAHRSYIILLKPDFKGGKLIVEPYDRDNCSGCYLDLTKDIRIYGMGYLGRAAGSKLAELAPSLPDDKQNILLLHSMVGRMGGDLIGSIPKSDVACLKERVSYLALGHGHNCYVVDKLASQKVDTTTAEDASLPKGQLSLFDLLAVSTEEMEESSEFVITETEDYRNFWGHNPGSIEHCRLDEADHKQGFFYVEMIEGQLQKVEHISGRQRPAKIIVVDVTGVDTPEVVYQKIASDVREQVGELKELLLRLIVKGDIEFDVLEIDEERIRTEVTEICEPIILELELRANLPHFSISTQNEILDRETIEREVLLKKVNDRSTFRSLGSDLVNLILELKEDLLTGVSSGEVLSKVMQMAGEISEDS